MYFREALTSTTGASSATGRSARAFSKRNSKCRCADGNLRPGSRVVLAGSAQNARLLSARTQQRHGRTNPFRPTPRASVKYDLNAAIQWALGDTEFHDDVCQKSRCKSARDGVPVTGKPWLAW